MHLLQIRVWTDSDFKSLTCTRDHIPPEDAHTVSMRPEVAAHVLGLHRHLREDVYSAAAIA